jgi:hypothetical protein
MDRPGADCGVSETASPAFGAPGIAPTRTSSDKDFVTAALDGTRLWATIGHGIVNEVHWPSTGQPQIRDLGFYLVGNGHWIDLKRARRYRPVEWLASLEQHFGHRPLAHGGEPPPRHERGPHCGAWRLRYLVRRPDRPGARRGTRAEFHAKMRVRVGEPRPPRRTRTE